MNSVKIKICCWSVKKAYEDNIFTLQGKVASELSQQNIRLFAVFIDFRRAFDSVKHSLLCQTLHKTEIIHYPRISIEKLKSKSTWAQRKRTIYPLLEEFCRAIHWAPCCSLFYPLISWIFKKKKGIILSKSWSSSYFSQMTLQSFLLMLLISRKNSPLWQNIVNWNNFRLIQINLR